VPNRNPYLLQNQVLLSFVVKRGMVLAGIGIVMGRSGHGAPLRVILSWNQFNKEEITT
jgi:hypothetical protein